jgi:catechol 2,3-dioxygenase-like lactoylglutathione lyase family enzyme
VLGHIGINIPDLDAARRYYSDPWGFMLEAVCHHDRD